MQKILLGMCIAGLTMASVSASAQWRGGDGDRGRDRGRWDRGDNIVQCESVNRRTVECPADTRGGVRLVRKLSDTDCNEGRTWGYHRDRVWVSGGCRAQFEVGGRGGGGWNGGDYSGRTIRCESIDRNTVECPADTRGGVQLVRKLSDTRCTQNQTWGYRRDRVWVSGGCRAEFRIGGGGGRY